MKNANTVELMTFMGFFGAIISAIQMYPSLFFLDLYVYILKEVP